MTNTNTILATVNNDLERIAERHGDLTPLLYERFFNADPEAAALMSHTDQAMQGRMLQQTLELLLGDEHLGADGYLAWELENHLIGYGVTRPMYAAYLQVILELLVREAEDEAAAAWAERVRVVMARIDAFEARRTAAQATQTPR